MLKRLRLQFLNVTRLIEELTKEGQIEQISQCARGQPQYQKKKKKLFVLKESSWKKYVYFSYMNPLKILKDI